MRSIVVHGHFYQPPREDPWSEVVEPEPAAAPFPDWNTRITHECYEPFAGARLLDPAGHVTGQLNLFEWTSFNVTPVLMRWLEASAPEVYRAILAADRASAARLGGHGNAIATSFHHVILPLASRRDKVTEVRWGLADFRRRFGRDAEGFWMPETALDEETLVVLAEEGVRFTIVAPHQLERPRIAGGASCFAAGGGRELAVFAYDGDASHDAAFGELLHDGARFAARVAPPPALRKGDDARPGPDQLKLLSIALDGETFGHHRKFAEMAWGTAVTALSRRADVRVENFASFLAEHPARAPAIVVEPSSWSCPHGVERWRGNCGCGVSPSASHAWRRPLRSAFRWLARELDARFEARAAALFADPWAERDAYAAVAGLPREARRAYVPGRVATAGDEAFALLEGERSRLAMLGSCAWFFDEAAGHETVLMMRLAAHAIDLLGDERVEQEFIERLALANAGSAADAYRVKVLSMRARHHA